MKLALAGRIAHKNIFDSPFVNTIYHFVLNIIVSFPFVDSWFELTFAYKLL